MSGKKTKLKKIEFTSVDMVRRGANQESYINLYKSAGDPENPGAPNIALEAPNSDEIPQGLWKSIVDAVKSFLGSGGAENGNPEEFGEVEKAADTFSDKMAEQEIRDNRWKYQDALNMSIESILHDDSLSDEDKVSMMNTSVEQFASAYKEMCAKLVKTTAYKATSPAMEANVVGKSQENSPDKTEEGEEEMKIDKSRFTPEELAQYNALIAKGKVEDEDFVPEKEDEEDENEMHPEVKKALEEMKELTKSLEMKEMAGIAKKYAAPLGKKEDELAATLYQMKKSNEDTYNEYLAVLDQNVELVNKSGMFAEIGKSGRGVAGAANGVEAKIDSIAKTYQEKDPAMDYNTAVLKAWENHPELMEEYDAEY